MGSLQELLPLMEQQRDSSFYRLCEWAKLPNQTPLTPAQQHELQADRETFNKANEAIANLKRPILATPAASPETVLDRTAHAPNTCAAQYPRKSTARVLPVDGFLSRAIETHAQAFEGRGNAAPRHGLPDLSSQLPLHTGRTPIVANVARPSNGSLSAPQNFIAPPPVAQEHGLSQTGFGVLIPPRRKNVGSSSAGGAHAAPNIPTKRTYSSLVSPSQDNRGHQANMEPPQPIPSKVFVPPLPGFSDGHRYSWWSYKDMIYNSQTGCYYKTPPCPHCPAKGTYPKGVFQPFKGYNGLASHFVNHQDTHAKETLRSLFTKDNLLQYKMTIEQVQAAIIKAEGRD